MLSEKQIILKSKLYFKLFESALEDMKNIKYAIIKGDALSILAYNRPGARYFNDIDILIDKDNLEYLKKILKKHGFEKINDSRYNDVFFSSYSHQLIPYVKDIDGFKVYIDVNFDIFWGEYEGNRININEFLSDTQTINIYDNEIKTLSTIKSIIQLILHHYKDMNSIYLLSMHKSINILMFKDLYYLIKNHKSEITPRYLYDMCQYYDILPYAYCVLYYTYEVFNEDSFIKEYVDVLFNNEGHRLLNYYGLCNAERKVWKVDFKTRVQSNDIFSLIKNDLTDKDLLKIELNNKCFI